MASYDEDVLENKFFLSLQNKCPELFETASNNRWIICVPRSSSGGKYVYTDIDFQNHVLIPPEDEDSNRYRTVNSREVEIQANTITTGAGFSEVRAVRILFEETFFNKNDESYRVLCIASILEGGIAKADGPVPAASLHSIDDCKELLWGHTENRRTQKHLDETIELFNRSCDRLQGESLIHYVDAAHAMFTRAMQSVQKDNFIKKTARNNKAYLDSLKIAVETYVMHGVYRKVFKGISACVSTKDAKLNKLTRNLAQLQLRDLGVRPEFCINIPRAKRELSNLTRYSTPLGKLFCIRRVIMALMQPSKAVKQKEAQETPVMTTDDLLPILIFMVIKSQIPNWSAHLTFMNHFRFSKSNNDDEFGYYLATIEAAIEHILSGQLNSIEPGSSTPHKMTFTLSSVGAGATQRQDSTAEGSSIGTLFEFIREGNEEAVKALITKNQEQSNEAKLKLCHPLCSCDACEKILSRSRSDSAAVTAFSRDDRGCTSLHIASMYGHAGIMDILVSKGAVVNATDYHGSTPVHIACQRGHQNVTLMLLHYHADINPVDNDGNTPLHMCTANGHDDCVKALVYYDQGTHRLDVNAANDYGDTPLHLAAKWGYENIIEILLENGASVEARNRKKLTPINCAHNVKVTKLLMIVAAAQDDRHEKIRVDVHGSATLAKRRISVEDLIKAGKLQRRSSLGTTSPPRQPPTPTKKTKVEKLLRAVSDGDTEMVKFICGWSNLSDDEDDVPIGGRELCHPLCQCENCQPLQKHAVSSLNDVSANSTNNDGFSPLHVAALHGHDNLVNLFLRKGAQVNARSKTQHATALHLASQYNRPKIVEVLLKFGAKVNQRDARGNTPLHFCAMNGCTEAAHYILQYGGSVNQTNQKGNTPLHEAARWNYNNMVKILLQHGASVLCRNKQQLTALQLAQNDDIVNTLDKAMVDELNAADELEETGKEHADDQQQSPAGEQENQDSDSVIRTLFNALEQRDLQHLRDIGTSIRSFDRRQSLRHTLTRDRSAPRLDNHLLHQLSIINFDPATLRHVPTADRSTPLVTVSKDGTIELDPGRFLHRADNKIQSVRSPVEMSDMAAKLLITDASPMTSSPPGSPTESDVKFTLNRVHYHCEKRAKKVDNDENSNTESAEECG
ncbi:ankyrin repeat domain-containing protein 27-like [Lineus longissimus]|uniref:ankyrin repeat domain-containing protein 27-like n=1 Tax=Lineus longissimus TaxID=88925 RepID=UPI002B4C7F05